MLWVRREEGCSVIYELVASFKAEKRKVNVGDAWFRVSPLSLSLSLSVCLSLPLSLCQLEFWSADRRLPSFNLSPLSRNLSFISFFSSDRLRLGFLCFLPRRSRIGWKLLLIIFIFLTNLSTFRYAPNWCSETLFLHFEESLSTDNTRWLFSWALVAIIILCVRDLFRSYNITNFKRA